MKALTPYLFFNGNCQEAMHFYQSVFGGNLEMMTNAEAPHNACPQNVKLVPEQIMHASLTQGELMIMASDNPMSKPQTGDHISLSINCSTTQETEQLFHALSNGGKITMPLADTFWGAYFGMLIDKYGVHWMLNCQLNTAQS